MFRLKPPVTTLSIPQLCWDPQFHSVAVEGMCFGSTFLAVGSDLCPGCGALTCEQSSSCEEQLSIWQCLQLGGCVPMTSGLSLFLRSVCVSHSILTYMTHLTRWLLQPQFPGRSLEVPPVLGPQTTPHSKVGLQGQARGYHLPLTC